MKMIRILVILKVGWRELQKMVRPHLVAPLKIGGVSMGRCKNKALPGMDVCYIHANRDGMALAIRMYADKIKKLGGKI